MMSKTTLEWLTAFHEFCGAVVALDDAGGKGELGTLTVEQTERLKASLRNGIGEIATALKVFSEGMTEWEAIQPEIDEKIAAAEAAEKRLSGIGTSIVAKEERMALLAQEEDRLSAELATRRSELAAVEGSLLRYREQIAAL